MRKMKNILGSALAVLFGAALICVLPKMEVKAATTITLLDEVSRDAIGTLSAEVSGEVEYEIDSEQSAAEGSIEGNTYHISDLWIVVSPTPVIDAEVTVTISKGGDSYSYTFRGTGNINSLFPDGPFDLTVGSSGNDDDDDDDDGHHHKSHKKSTPTPPASRVEADTLISSINSEISKALDTDASGLRIISKYYNSFSKDMLTKLKEAGNKPVVLEYDYKGNHYVASIPSADQIQTELDWYGPLAIAGLYPTTVTPLN